MTVFPTATDRESDVLPVRPAQEAIVEILAMSLFAAFFAFMLLCLPGGNGALGALEAAPVAGTQILEHIGWGFGVYIPVMLGFYAIVIGGQLVASPALAARTRRRLGFVAEAMAGALAPAILLVVAACVDDPAKAGSLFMVLPTAGIMFFLAVQLGGFVVFEPALRLAEAVRSRAWAARRQSALRSRSRRPVWLVALVTSSVATLAGLAVTTAIAPLSGPELLLPVIHAMFAVGLTVVFLQGIETYLTARDRLGRTAACLFPVAMTLATLASVGALMMAGFVSGGVGLGCVVVLCVLSAAWPPPLLGACARDWSVRGAGVALAARSVARTYVKSVRTVRELQTPHPSPAGLRERLSAAISAIRGPAPASLAGETTPSRSRRSLRG